MSLVNAPLPCSLSRCLLAAVLLAMSAGAAGQNCTFRTAGSPINFPTLDPSFAVTATASMDIRVRCTPTSVSPTWSFSGANGNAPLQMKHSTQNAYIPYTISTMLLSTGGSREDWRVTGTVLGANYQNARVGAYSDLLTATITP